MATTGTADHAAAQTDGVYRWVIVAVGTGAQTSAAALLMGLASIAPVLRAEYGLGLTGLGLMLAAPMSGLVLTLVLWGHTSDRLGERFVMTAGLSMGAGILAIVPMLNGPAPVMFALAAAGASVAGVNAASGHAVMLWFPSHGRGTAMAVRQCALPLGAALGAATLPALAATGGLRAAFWALAGFAATMAGTVALLVHGPGDFRRAVYGRGAAEAAVERPNLGTVPQRLTTAATRTRALFGNRPLRRVCAVAALLIFPQVALTGFLVELLGAHANRSATQAAQALACLHVAAIGLRLFVGWWSDLTGDRLRLIRQVALAMAVGFIGLTVLLATAVDSLLVELAVVSVGAIAVCWNGLAFLAAGELAPPGRAGAFLGVENTALFGAAAVGSVAVGVLADGVGWTVTIGALVAPSLVAAAILAHGRLPARREAFSAVEP